jgi:VWFA-related protein
LLAASAVLSAQQPTFRVGVTLVTTDVIPRDANGRFVADLKKEDFTVLEDGQPQEITSFQMIQGGRTYNLLAPPPAASVVPEGLVLPQPKPRTNDVAGRVLLIFIDDLHFEPEISPHVRRVMQQIADTLVHEGDLVTVISSGPSFIEIGPT